MPEPAFTRLAHARRMASELTVTLADAARASDRAVMAASDEASSASARDAERLSAQVEQQVHALSDLLRGLRYTGELALLTKLEAAFQRYRVVDRETLALALQNSNVKAQRLSFGAGAEAVEHFRDALDRVSSAVQPAHACDVRLATTTALLDLREIQVLEGPHILAAEDPVMDGLEQRMAKLEAGARTALQQVAPLAAASQSPLTDATAALDEFIGIHREVVQLSRQNSNVRSLAMSLGEKRVLFAACQDAAHALAERLDQREFKATR